MKFQLSNKKVNYCSSNEQFFIYHKQFKGFCEKRKNKIDKFILFAKTFQNFSFEERKEGKKKVLIFNEIESSILRTATTKDIFFLEKNIKEKKIKKKEKKKFLLFLALLVGFTFLSKILKKV